MNKNLFMLSIAGFLAQESTDAAAVLINNMKAIMDMLPAEQQERFGALMLGAHTQLSVKPEAKKEAALGGVANMMYCNPLTQVVTYTWKKKVTRPANIYYNAKEDQYGSSARLLATEMAETTLNVEDVKGIFAKTETNRDYITIYVPNGEHTTEEGVCSLEDWNRGRA